MNKLAVLSARSRLMISLTHQLYFFSSKPLKAGETILRDQGCLNTMSSTLLLMQWGSFKWTYERNKLSNFNRKVNPGLNLFVWVGHEEYFSQEFCLKRKLSCTLIFTQKLCLSINIVLDSKMKLTLFENKTLIIVTGDVTVLGILAKIQELSLVYNF